MKLVSLLKIPEIASLAFAILMCILYALMKLYIRHVPDKIEKTKAALEFPINLCSIFTSSLIAVEISKGEKLMYALIAFAFSMLVVVLCCIFRSNANSALLKENSSGWCIFLWALLDWGFSMGLGGLMFVKYIM